ncbi:MAG: hypothetical protein GX956_00035 [Firmicutes bacterium]|nr:hypothetical protein [Bacillota bacterium]
MKRKGRFLSVAILFLVTVLLTGCVGGLFGKSPEDQIRNFLKQVETAMKKQDAQKLANSFTYPIKMETDRGVIEYEQDEFEHIIGAGFATMKAEGATIVDFKIDLANAEIIVDKSGDSAVIKKATLSITVSLAGEEATEGPIEIPELELKKVGKQWKFDSDAAWILDSDFDL